MKTSISTSTATRRQSRFARVLSLVLALLMLPVITVPFVVETAADFTAFVATTDFNNLTPGTYGEFSNYATRWAWVVAKENPIPAYVSDTAVTVGTSIPAGSNGNTSGSAKTVGSVFRGNIPGTRISGSGNIGTVLTADSSLRYYQIVDDGTGNRYIRVPFEGYASSDQYGWPEFGNSDGRLRMRTGNTYSYAADGCDTVAIDMKLKYEYDGSTSNQLAECQLTQVWLGGTRNAWPTFFRLDLTTGGLMYCGTHVDDTPEGLTANKWTSVQIVLNMATGVYSLALDGVTCYTGGHLTGSNNNVIDNANVTTLNTTDFVPIMCVRRAGAYTANSTTAVSVDDISFYAYNSGAIPVTIDGSTQAVASGNSVTIPSGYKYYFVTPFGQETYASSASSVTITEPTVIKTVKAATTSDLYNVYSEEFTGLSFSSSSGSPTLASLKITNSIAARFSYSVGDGALTIPVTAASNGAGNDNLDITIPNRTVTYSTERYFVVEEDFTLSDLSGQIIECRVISHGGKSFLTADDASGTNQRTENGGDYWRLFIIKTAGGVPRLYYGQQSGGSFETAGATALAFGTTYRIRTVIDLKEGRQNAFVCTLTDGVEGNWTVDVSNYKMSTQRNIGNNKYVSHDGGNTWTYNGTSNWYVYKDGLTDITVNGSRISIFCCQNAEGHDSGSITLDNIHIYAGNSYSEDFESFAANDKITSSKFVNEQRLPNSTYTIATEANGNKYVKIPLVASTSNSAGADYSTSPIDCCIPAKSRTYSYLTSGAVVIEVKYFFSLGTRGRFQTQIRSYKYWRGLSETTANYGCLSRIWFYGWSGSDVETAAVTDCGQVIDESRGPKSGQWNSFRYIIDLRTGTYDTYINGELYAKYGPLSGEDVRYNTVTDRYNFTILGESGISFAKTNKLIADDNTFDSVVDGTYIGVDDINIYDLRTDGAALSYSAKSGYLFYSDFEDSAKGSLFNATTMPRFGFTNDSFAGNGVSSLDFEETTVIGGQTYSAGNTCLSIPLSVKDKHFYAANSTVSYDNLPNGDNVLVYEANYRFSANTAANAYIEARLAQVIGDSSLAVQQIYYTETEEYAGRDTSSHVILFAINPKTGKISYPGKVNAASGEFASTGALTLSPNVWYNIRLVIDMTAGSYEVYVNGKPDYTRTSLTGQFKKGDIWWYPQNLTNLRINASKFEVMIFDTAGTANASVTASIDDVKIYTAKAISVNGETLLQSPTETVDLRGSLIMREDGTLRAGAIETIGSTIDAGEEITSLPLALVNGGSIRLSSPTGLRFKTAINKDIYDALAEVADDISFGTIIAPRLYVNYAAGDGVDFTKEAFDDYFSGDEPGYIDVEVDKTFDNGWFEEDSNYYYFAGSITRIQDYSRKFVARSYLTYTIDGETYTIYSNDVAVRSVKAIATAAKADGTYWASLAALDAELGTHYQDTIQNFIDN